MVRSPSTVDQTQTRCSYDGVATLDKRLQCSAQNNAETRKLHNFTVAIEWILRCTDYAWMRPSQYRIANAIFFFIATPLRSLSSFHCGFSYSIYRRIGRKETILFSFNPAICTTNIARATDESVRWK